MATKTVYIKTALLGGTTNSVDGIDGADLLDGDFAFTTISGVLYHHVLDDDSAAAEFSPDIIAPDQNPGDKRWILQNVSLASPGAIGGTTPAPGAFTTLMQTTGKAAGAIPISDADGALTLTASTGSGAPVRATSPTLVTPALGTPASGNLSATIQAGALSALDVRDFIHDDGSGNSVISTMAFIPKFVTSGWPQAALNGLNVGGFWIDVYKNSQPDATSIYRGSTSPDTPGSVAATSRPGVSLWDDISWISARIAASNRTINGRACHLVTPFEKFAAMSWIMKSGNWGNVRGNNNNG